MLLKNCLHAADDSLTTSAQPLARQQLGLAQVTRQPSTSTIQTLSRMYFIAWTRSGETCRSRTAILDAMVFAIKAEVRDPRKTLEFTAQKTMYGGKNIAEGDTVFIFASENEGGRGLIARGVVSAAESIAKKADVVRQTPRVSITVKYIEAAKRSLGRSELKRFTDWKDGRPETELNFKFYRRATNKIVSVSDHTAAFLDQFF